ncbi:hypothetical protein N656DRAFT_782751 [Canariomyces notabilis]|uniref:Uncharacterized protein n=1 Tax=Canariomyces notabilis TaxID=2074819 RepID=A0AAN6QIR0_9PEZI|nr:hypothetical protein N656DRAFT_782751 [Canariomyces arenarius]
MVGAILMTLEEQFIENARQRAVMPLVTWCCFRYSKNCLHRAVRAGRGEIRGAWRTARRGWMQVPSRPHERLALLGSALCGLQLVVLLVLRSRSSTSRAAIRIGEMLTTVRRE